MSDQARLLYQNLLLDLGKKIKKRFKIVIDCGNGPQSLIIPLVLQKLGHEVHTLNCDLTKPLLSRDTETENSFPELAKSKEMIQGRADLGIGFDSDGDRAIFIDELGQALDGEESGAILAHFSPQKVIVAPINASQMLEKLGKKVVRTKVGVLYVVEAMRENQTLTGLESNGGFISGEYFYGRDAGTATIKMLLILTQTQKSLSQLRGELPRFFIYKDKISCPRRFNSVILKTMASLYSGRVENLDGLKIWLDQDTWILFRPSGNAEEFRVFAESKEPAKSENLVKKGLKNIETILAKN